ncbi:MAG: LptF/LptG family permease [Myxococcota bacterium]|nr:LptF/LptG family permease [Myxococcota bacterium]
MRTFDRYLLREILLPLFVGLGLFFVVVAFGQVLKISDSLTGLGVSGGRILEALLYSFPPLMGLLLPVSILFATLLGVGRFAADREVIGFASLGVSPYRLFKVPCLLGIIISMISCWAMVKGEPWGIRGLRNLMAFSAQEALAGGVRPGEFHEWVYGFTFRAEEKDGDDLKAILLADRRDADKPIVISSARGRILGGKNAQDLIFDLEDGTMLLTDAKKKASRKISFKEGQYRLNVGSLVGNKARTMRKIQEKTLGELWELSRHAPKEKHKRQAIILLHRKFALPLAAFIFTLLSVPLACTARGGSRARGFLFSTAIVGGYYYLGRAVELSARAGNFDPILAAWLPDIIGLVMAVILIVRFRRTWI